MEGLLAQTTRKLRVEGWLQIDFHDVSRAKLHFPVVLASSPFCGVPIPVLTEAEMPTAAQPHLSKPQLPWGKGSLEKPKYWDSLWLNYLMSRVHLHPIVVGGRWEGLGENSDWFSLGRSCYKPGSWAGSVSFPKTWTLNHTLGVGAGAQEVSVGVGKQHLHCGYYICCLNTFCQWSFLGIWMKPDEQ